MNVTDSRMSRVERAVFGLRGLYERYGYKKYTMSKFEEYDLYLENKSFLPRGQIITFTDLNGKLLALKPDVTLSIAKNVAASRTPEKVYYNENVYRTPRGSGQFREIAQVGLEFIGDIDVYNQSEVISLAYRSLEILSGEFVLTLSHMGFVSGLLEFCGLPPSLEGEALGLIEQKNAHELTRLCAGAGLAPGKSEALVALTGLYGGFEETLERAEKFAANGAMSGAVSDLTQLFSALSPRISSDKIRLDFSVINDLTYYNGLIFQGYVPQIPRAVLSGGRYDNLMEKLGKNVGAIGFAVYVNELERGPQDEGAGDVDVLLLYDDATPPERVARAVDELAARGKSVSALRRDTGAVRYRELMRLGGEGANE